VMRVSRPEQFGSQHSANNALRSRIKHPGANGGFESAVRSVMAGAPDKERRIGRPVAVVGPRTPGIADSANWATQWNLAWSPICWFKAHARAPEKPQRRPHSECGRVRITLPPGRTMKGQSRPHGPQ